MNIKALRRIKKRDKKRYKFLLLTGTDLGLSRGGRGAYEKLTKILSTFF